MRNLAEENQVGLKGVKMRQRKRVPHIMNSTNIVRRGKERSTLGKAEYT